MNDRQELREFVLNTIEESSESFHIMNKDGNLFSPGGWSKDGKQSTFFDTRQEALDKIAELMKSPSADRLGLEIIDA
ncbi:unnamed protein product [marine sediment metagenome]|uniref:Uncharacterized protein n=1 Tax=marine sediment metagenome TaxID=412755 RepID=X1RZ75_9ZZZZ